MGGSVPSNRSIPAVSNSVIWVSLRGFSSRPCNKVLQTQISVVETYRIGFSLVLPRLAVLRLLSRLLLVTAIHEPSQLESIEQGRFPDFYVPYQHHLVAPSAATRCHLFSLEKTNFRFRYLLWVGLVLKAWLDKPLTLRTRSSRLVLSTAAVLPGKTLLSRCGPQKKAKKFG